MKYTANNQLRRSIDSRRKEGINIFTNSPHMLPQSVNKFKDDWWVFFLMGSNTGIGDDLAIILTDGLDGIALFMESIVEIDKYPWCKLK